MLSKKPATILIIEEDLPVRELLTELLQHEGYGVTAVSSGQEALSLLACAHQLRLIFLDHMMSTISGSQILALSQIPVVITSSVAVPLKLVGAKSFLKKPYEIESVLKVVHQYC